MNAYINRYELSSKNLAEFQWVYVTRQRKMLLVLFALVCLSSMGLLGIVGYAPGATLLSSVILCAFTPFVLILGALKIKRDAIMKSASCARQNEGKMSMREIGFGATCFTVKDDHVATTIECAYQSIKKISETKTLFIFEFQNGTVLMLKKDGFSPSDYSKFRDYVWERRMSLAS